MTVFNLYSVTCHARANYQSDRFQNFRQPFVAGDARGDQYHPDAERFGECGGAGLCDLSRPAGGLSDIEADGSGRGGCAEEPPHRAREGV